MLNDRELERDAVFSADPKPSQSQAAETASAEKYRTLFEAIDEGFTIIEVLFDGDDRPYDYRFLETNPAFERQTGIENAEGRCMREIAPQLEQFWFDTYGRVARTGEPIRFEHRAEAMGRWFDVYAMRSGELAQGHVAVLFTDITERKTIEAERVQMVERERNIALQLQEALTPPLPARVAGMSLAKYYKAALSESKVGGDFYDVFPVKEHCTALVVGDLAGKGLAAASQVATVRNMLRYAVYRARTLAEGMRGLNALLVEQSLLTGFATLFAGFYDAEDNTLSYVNAGQEPALVLRTTGQIEMLPPTGPVFGAFEGASFEQKVIALRPGDALAIFTDGLTEVGAKRTSLLGFEGVADLLRQCLLPEEEGQREEQGSAREQAQRLMQSLVEGVSVYAQNGVRDDACLLLGVVETPLELSGSFSS